MWKRVSALGNELGNESGTSRVVEGGEGKNDPACRKAGCGSMRWSHRITSCVPRPDRRLDSSQSKLSSISCLWGEEQWI